jgi:hypothetical protein
MCKKGSESVTLKKWVAGSLAGHLAGVALVFSVPFLIWFLVENHVDGTLTIYSLTRFLVIDFGVGAILAAAGWYTITLPTIRKSRRLDK